MTGVQTCALPICNKESWKTWPTKKKVNKPEQLKIDLVKKPKVSDKLLASSLIKIRKQAHDVGKKWVDILKLAYSQRDQDLTLDVLQFNEDKLTKYKETVNSFISAIKTNFRQTGNKDDLLLITLFTDLASLESDLRKYGNETTNYKPTVPVSLKKNYSARAEVQSPFKERAQQNPGISLTQIMKLLKDSIGEDKDERLIIYNKLSKYIPVLKSLIHHGEQKLEDKPNKKLKDSVQRYHWALDLINRLKTGGWIEEVDFTNREYYGLPASTHFE